jgi:transposase-like protein
MHRVHHHQATREQEFVLDLDEIARQGARKMLAGALQAEVDAYLEAAEGERDEHTGHALVVRNGYHNSREVLCGAGAIEVRAPRVHKTANVLDALPKSVRGRAKKAIAEITEAENKTEAKKAVKALEEEFGTKWPKAAAKIVSDEEALL